MVCQIETQAKVDIGVLGKIWSGLLLSLTLLATPGLAEDIATPAPLPEKFTPFEFRLQSLLNSLQGNPEAALTSLLALKTQSNNPDENAIITAVQCDLYAQAKKTNELRNNVADLDQEIIEHNGNFTLRAVRELCAFHLETDYNERDKKISMAYHYVRFSPLATLRYWISTMYVETAGRQGRGRDAIDAARMTLFIAKSNEDMSRLAYALRSLAAIEADLGETANALDHIDEAIEIIESSPIPQVKAILLSNRAAILLGAKRLLEARVAVEKALEFSKGMQPNPTAQNNLINQIQLTYQEGKFSESKHITETLMAEVQKQAGPDAAIVIAFANTMLGLNAYRMGHPETGEALFKLGIDELASRKMIVELREDYELLADALFATGNFRQAFLALKKQIEFNDQIERESRGHHADELRNVLQTEKREKENIALRELSQRNQIEVERSHLRLQRWWLLATALGLALFIAGQMVWNVRKRNSQLQNLNRELDTQRYQDALTGLFNRRYLIEHEAQFWREALEQKTKARCTAVLLIDADHFKRINDQYGHAAGDAALVEMTKRLRLSVRETDTLIRWGGEEFLIFTEAPNKEAVQALATRILLELQREAIHYDDKDIPITASIGYVILPLQLTEEEPLDMEDSLKLVDAALYLAKENGRNRAFGLTQILESTRGRARLIRELGLAWHAGEVDIVTVVGDSIQF